MKLSFVLPFALTIGRTLAHYGFSILQYDGVTSDRWEYMRTTANDGGGWFPLIDINDPKMRCFTNETSPIPNTLKNIVAGTDMTVFVEGYNDRPVRELGLIVHESVNNIYMARAPNDDAAMFDGSGDVWFKIHEDSVHIDGKTITFPILYTNSVTFQVPKNVPSGQYLVRVENIALHNAFFGEPQFFIGCAQIEVVNGGTGKPGPLVPFPGAHKGDEPSLNLNIYEEAPSEYIQPGPPIWN